jgi:hypothetical protein
MPDYPSSEGYTTSQLKAAFDAPATGLKTDLNGLMQELEGTDSATNLGADALDASDNSDANVQAKLEYLLAELQGIALGDIPDGTITEAKMDSTYEGTLAKKDGELQTGLNAEKLSGTTLAGIQALIAAQSHEKGAFTVSYSAGDETTKNYVLNLGYNPCLVIYIRQSLGVPTLTGFPAFGIIIGGRGLYYDINATSPIKTYDAEANGNGVTIKEFRVKSGDNTYTHNMSYIAFR